MLTGTNEATTAEGSLANLNLAWEALHRRLLPPAPPQPEGWTLLLHHLRQRRPGNDYYDFLSSDSGECLSFVVGDVTDAAGPATVTLALVRALLHSCPLTSGRDQAPFCCFGSGIPRPNHFVLSHLNDALVENSLPGQSMSAFLGTLDPLSGVLYHANAGHLPPLWWRAASHTLVPLGEAVGPPLGTASGKEYTLERVVLEPGDLLFCYTDGLTEARNDRGEPFGLERLKIVLNLSARGGAEGVKSAVLSGWEGFRGGVELADDVTFFVLQRSATSARVELNQVAQQHRCCSSCLEKNT
jgi:sigma-B regulation protein RsbU (phosphoserine phosphatase)